MNLKKGVIAHNVQGPIFYAIGVAEMVYRLVGLKLTVTSLTDGTHSPGSLHYKGLACDLRTRGLDGAQLHQLAASIKNVLDPQGYDVVLEKDHIHVEYDPKAGESWQKEIA